jgi:hypothetical protein
MMMISGMCCDVIVASVKILIEECSRSIQSPAVWRSLLIIVSTSDRNPQTFDEAIETLNDLMIGPHLTRSNYLSWLNAAFNLGVHKITPLDKSFNYYGNARQVYQPNMQWHKSSISEPNNNSSESSMEDLGSRLTPCHLFMKLVEAIGKPSLARREEIYSKHYIQTAAE